MARMYPRTLNLGDVKSDGERRVFERLRDSLDDSWIVFHSASLVVRDAGEGTTDDECDFVLAHPQDGVIALEVKGGGLECRNGEWYRVTDSGATRERIRDPGTQAIDHMHNLRRKLQETDLWKTDAPRLMWALALPDVTVHELVLAPDMPPELILDRSELRDDPAGSIAEVIKYSTGARPKGLVPGTEGLEQLRDLLAPEVDLPVRLVDDFGDEQVALRRLTNEQAHVLHGLRTNRRVLVRGCAGSGKTLLGLTRARELADDDQDVLFVCFNRGLVEDVKRRGLAGGADVATFHGLCTRLAHRAEIELPEYDGTPPQDYWREQLPNALVEAVAVLGSQYDAIVVDEAQDLHDDWLAALACTLHDEAQGSMWLFMDDNQRVFESDLTVPPGYVEYELSVNCRNTRAIHREVAKLYSGRTKPDVRGPEGREPELLHTDDQPAAVAALLERFVNEEGVAAQDIVVLSSHAVENSSVGRDGSGRFQFAKEPSTGADTVQFSSIRAFKGLESPVVILCELEDLPGESQDAQLYVGMSRAVHHCVVVAPPDPAGST